MSWFIATLIGVVMIWIDPLIAGILIGAGMIGALKVAEQDNLTAETRKRLCRIVLEMQDREEWLGGQRFKYVKKAEVMDVIAMNCCKVSRIAPTASAAAGIRLRIAWLARWSKVGWTRSTGNGDTTACG